MIRAVLWSKMPWRRLAFTLLPLLSLILLTAGVFLLPPVAMKGDLGYEMMNLGESLARNGTFADPLAAWATGPTATEPPLYPLILALLIKIFGDVPGVLLGATLVTIAAGAATAVLIHALVKRLLDGRAAVFAAGLWLASSWMGSTPHWIFWDAAVTPLLLLWFCFATLDPPGKPGFAESILLPGTLLGALFLSNPAALVLAGLWLVWRAWVWGALPWRQWIGLCLIAGALGAPWIIRNFGLWGRLIVRENFGYTLYTSNNPCAVPLLAANLGNHCYAQTHPNENAAEAQLMQRLGEPEYDRVKTAEATAWIRDNPGRFAGLTAWRMLYFWFPTPKDLRVPAYGTWLVTALSIPGLILLWRSRADLALFVTAASLVYPAVYYIVVADIRYRAPFAWIAVIPAAYLCGRIVKARVRE
jgi:hypothetical protein